MEPVFDAPQWVFQIPPEGTEDSMVKVSVHCTGEDEEFRGVADLIAPSEFFKYAKDVLKLTDIGEALFYLDLQDKRWYLVVSTLQNEHTLWYYTKSSLPEWARRVYGE